MKKFQSILKKVFFLPPLATVLIAVPSFGFVIYVLANRMSGAPAYLSYALSAYALAITVTGVVRMIKAVRAGFGNYAVVRKLLDHPFGGRYFTDAAFRAEVSLYPSLCINMLYAAVKMVSGILYGSMWLITLSVYYILLSIMRFLLLVFARKKHSGAEPDFAAQLRRYRVCGLLLACMNLALSGMVLFMVRREGGYDYPGMLIYVMALYTFYAVITAAINIVKFRRHGSPILSAAKAINLTAALVSMLALETAMLSQFGAEDDMLFRQIMVASTGAAVCGFIFAMAVYMVFRSTKQLRELKAASGQADAQK